MDDHLYVGGVCSESGRERCRLFEYSLSFNTWDVFDTHLAEFTLVSYKSKLLLIGGVEHEFHTLSSSKKTPINEVWQLNNESYKLEEADVPSMKIRRKCAHAVSHKKHLVVVGGDDDQTVRTIEVYNDDTHEWLFAPNLPQSSSVQSVVIHHGGDLYIQLRLLNEHGSSLRVFWASLDSITTHYSSVPNDVNSFWTEILLPRDVDIHTNLMLYQGYLVVMGSYRFSIHPNQNAVFVYHPSACTCWVEVASVEHFGNKVCIIHVSRTEFLMFGLNLDVRVEEVLLLLSFQGIEFYFATVLQSTFGIICNSICVEPK